MFLISLDDIESGIVGYIKIFIIAVFVIFLFTGGIYVGYAIDIGIVICSIYFGVAILISILKELKKNAKKGLKLLTLFIILSLIGYIFPFYNILTSLKYSRICSILIPNFIVSFIYESIFNGDINNWKNQKFFQTIKSLFTDLWYFLFYEFFARFGSCFLIGVAIVFFGYMQQMENQQYTKLTNLINQNFTYDYIFYDKERAKYNNQEEMILLIIDYIKNDMYNDTDLINEISNDQFLNSKYRTEIENGGLQPESFFKNILDNYTQKLSKDYGEKFGYFIHSSSKYIGSSQYILNITDHKYSTKLYYFYDFNDNTLTKTTEEEYLLYSDCSDGLCSKKVED